MSFPWADLDVRRALGMNPDRADPELVFSGVCTDSRKLEEGCLFVALRGERFDAHDFVAEALSRGAAGAVVSRKVKPKVEPEDSTRLYPVDDTLAALGALANHRRRALNARVVGITGSSGKTTTKDLLTAALEGSIRVHATEGNLNNRIGLPLTILHAPRDAELLVVEMGTNEPGEIGILTGVAEPDLGVITTVSASHLEKLGSLEGVLDEKLDLLRGLSEDAPAVVGDEPGGLAARARELVSDLRVTGLSREADEELRPRDVEVGPRGCFRFQWKGEDVWMGMPGRHSVQNALVALAVADALGVEPAEAVRRVGRVEARGMRSEIRMLGGLTLVVDCYNANPQSVAAALDLLETIQELGPRVAVLGSMLELGEDRMRLHRETLRTALARPLDLLVVTGLFAEAAEDLDTGARGPELVVAPTLEAAGEVLARRLGGSEVVLLKASRGVAMEGLIPALEDRFQAEVQGSARCAVPGGEGEA